ncbi:MAG: ribbon-helix-helix protein, CopG family [Chthoniobacter sp.]|nr:ribbon-helix-helix protein, CopG family [Chthoniobacter sp.]
MKKRKRRGSVTAAESEFIGVWIPKPLVALLDHAVRMTDSDRSKILRAAVREKLERTA